MYYKIYRNNFQWAEKESYLILGFTSSLAWEPRLPADGRQSQYSEKSVHLQAGKDQRNAHRSY